MTIEKVKTIAKEKYGKDLTDAQAAEYAEKYGKLTNDELDSVAGGCGAKETQYCPVCGSEMSEYNNFLTGMTSYSCPNGCK